MTVNFIIIYNPAPRFDSGAIRKHDLFHVIWVFCRKFDSDAPAERMTNKRYFLHIIFLDNTDNAYNVIVYCQWMIGAFALPKPIKIYQCDAIKIF